MDVFMQIEGIKGSVSEANHPGWIHVKTIAYSVVRPVRQIRTSDADDRVTGKSYVTQMRVTRRSDDTSIRFFEEACGISALAGSAIPSVTIDLCQEGKVNSQFVLSEVLIGDYQETHDGGNLEESFSLYFTTIQKTHNLYDPKNKEMKPFTTTYNMKTGGK